MRTQTPRQYERSWWYSLRVPNATVSEDEALAVYNADVTQLAEWELWRERSRAFRIAERNPRALVWRGTEYILVEQWASERIGKINAALNARQGNSRSTRRSSEPRSIAWT